MEKSLFVSALLVSVLFVSSESFAWGRRGHQVVGETAAILVSDEPEADFMRDHSFDFGYYANVPDFIWKRPATYELERNEHFMDLEIFRRELAKHPEVKKPMELSRKEFEEKFPDIKPNAGRAFWRIRELNDQLTQVSEELRTLAEPTGAARQKLQEKWMVVAGTMAHYVGDLSMPLHVSENYDGQLTDQKGVHSYFEDQIVNQIYPAVGTEVHQEAGRKWAAFRKQNAKKTTLELIEELGQRSEKAVPALLAIDKKSKRENVKKNVKAYHKMIRERLVDSSLVLSEIYRRQLGFKFDNERFYFFAGEPSYITPGAVKEAKVESPIIKK